MLIFEIIRMLNLAKLFSKNRGNELGKFLIVKFLIFYTVNMNFPMHIMKKLTVWLSYFKNVMDLIA